MPASPSTASTRDYRSDALLCAIRTCSTATSDLLARHPQADKLRARASAEDSSHPLAKLLWQELIDEEKACLGSRGSYYVDPAEGRPVQYWQRRQRLNGWVLRREATKSLPQPWPRILDLPSAGARELCVVIGTEMVTRACIGQPMSKIAPRLGPLGADVAGQVVERLGRGKLTAFPAPIAARWMDAYQRMARQVAGDRIVSGLGRALLATLFRRLPEAQRKAAIAVSRSNLPGLMQSDTFLEPMPDEELALAQKLAQALLPRGSATT